MRPTFLLERDPNDHLVVRIRHTATRGNLGLILLPEDFDDPLGYAELLQQVCLTGRLRVHPPYEKE